MKPNQIKKTLFALVGLLAAPAMAHAEADKPKLTMVDQLPLEQRAVVYKTMVQYLMQNPEVAQDANGVIAIDEKGVVYVVDKNTVMSGSGQPSCAGGSSGTGSH